MQIFGIGAIASLFLLAATVEAGRTCVVGHSGKNNEVAPIQQAFKDCNNGGTVVFPAGQTYNLKGVIAVENLKQVTVKFDSIINMPVFKTSLINEKAFLYISGDNIHFSGSGTINGNGQGWYDAANNKAPTLFKIKATNSYFGGFHVKQAPRAHFSVNGSKNLTIENLSLNTVSKNANKPAKNTDAFDVSGASDIIIRNSNIVNGDDCIAVNGGVTNLLVTGLSCTGSHGFSVGSLGKDGKTESVTGLKFINNRCTNCSNGVRIKTWPGGKGNVKDITFDNINLQNVEHPILITTHYCDNNKISSCNKDDSSSLSIDGVKINNIYGTVSSKDHPILEINCSTKTPCKNVTVDRINITKNSKTKKNICINFANSGLVPQCKQ
ncbi:pectin lyase fold/virulence factor [Phycomyces nitens]|nr:pectin lyase fold/virulence factor [Phycomyces nitens]